VNQVRHVLFTLARSSLVGWLVGWLFAHMSFVIPVHRLRETDTLIAFHHPKPSYPVHILLVPKRQLSNLLAVGPAEADFFADLYRIVPELVIEFDLEKSGYTLLVNGGAYQDVPQLHFHLISNDKPST
jgi:histidine triad (HIT) family protein